MENRGGKRENSGRKKIENGKRVSFIIPENKIEELKQFIKKLKYENRIK